MAKISALTDTFDVADAAKWSGYGGSVTVSGGLLSIAANFTGLATVTADWDATGSSIFVEVVNGGWLQLTNGADDRAMVFADVNGTDLFMQTYQAGVFAGSDSIAYSTTTHRWWRLRMDAAATNVFLDTAPDGATWTQRLTLGITPTGNYATTTLVSLRSGGSNPVTMDNVNTPPGGGGGGGAVSYVAGSTMPLGTGTGTSATTTLTVGYPAGNQEKDLLVLYVAVKPDTTTITTPSGWTAVSNGELAGGGGTTGVDTGPTRLKAFYREVPAGGLSGSLSVTISAAGSAWGWMGLCRSPSAELASWSVAGANGVDSTTGTPFTAAMNVDPGIAVKDLVFVAGSIPTDVSTPSQFSAETLTAAGLTSGTVTEIGEPDTTQGNDLGGVICRWSPTAGPSSGVATFSATAGGTTTNVRGPIVLVRVRDTSTAVPASGTVVGTSALTGAVTMTTTVTSTVSGVSAASGDATRVGLTLAAAGTVAAVSAVTGDATRVGVILSAAGTVASTSSVSGVVVARLLAAGGVPATSTVIGAATRVPLTLSAAGVVSATSTASGDATRVALTLAAAGVVAATTVASGAVTAIEQVAGTAVATSGLSGDATRVGAVLAAAGVVAATSAVSGDVSRVGLISSAAGVVAGTTAVSGNATRVALVLSAAGTVAATTAVIGSATRTAMVLPAAGSIDASSSSIGAVAQRATISGSVTSTSSVTGDATRVGASLAVSGTVAAVSGVTGNAVRVGLIAQAAGVVAASSTVSGTATVSPRAAAGTVAGTSAVSGNAVRVPLILSAAGVVEGTTSASGSASRTSLTLAAAGVVLATAVVSGDPSRVGLVFSAAGVASSTSATVGSVELAVLTAGFWGLPRIGA